MNKKGRMDLTRSCEFGDDAARLMKSIPVEEQAVGRMKCLGPTVLSSAELLGLILGCDAQPLLPLRLLAAYGSLIEIANASPRDFELRA